MWNPFTAIADIQRTIHTIDAKVDQLMSQSDEISADVAAIETVVGQINDGVSRATALIQQLEASQGQPVDPAVLASLKQAVADISTAGQSVSTLAPPAS